MGTSTTVLVAVGLLSGVLLLARLPRVPVAGPASTGTSVSVVVPARDEQARLPRLLESLARQGGQAFELLVVDDGSQDATAEVARRAGARVLSARDRPAGWLGKPWACHQGAMAATGDVLVFLDADVWLAPDALARLVAAHRRRAPDGLLSVQPYHEVRRPHEQLSAVCNTVSVLASGMAAVGAPATAEVAFGPCLVTRADDLRAVGGFESVAGEVAEDLALAAAYRASGRPVVCLGGGDAVRFRMYPDGMASLAEGWTKNLAVGASRAAGWPRVGAVAWVAAGMAVLAGAVVDPSAWVLGAWALYGVELWWMLRRLGSFHPLTAVLFPVPLLAFVGLFARSALVHLLGRPVSWRGRRLELSRGTVR
jgi:4,4'-diaponeurosporenoate glycosyltransferase